MSYKGAVALLLQYNPKRAYIMRSKASKKEQEVIKKLNSLLLVPIINSYLIDTISLSDYTEFEDCKTQEDKLRAVSLIYKKETGALQGGPKECESWMKGLPSVLIIIFYDYDVLTLLCKWGVLDEVSKYVNSGPAIDAWWSCIALRLTQMMRKVERGEYSKIRFIKPQGTNLL